MKIKFGKIYIEITKKIPNNINGIDVILFETKDNQITEECNSAVGWVCHHFKNDYGTVIKRNNIDLESYKSTLRINAKEIFEVLLNRNEPLNENTLETTTETGNSTSV